MRKINVILLPLLIAGIGFSQYSKVGKNLKSALEGNKISNKNLYVLIYLTDKGNNIQKLSNPLDLVSERSLNRRSKIDKNNLVDISDVPVFQDYINQLKPYLVKFRHTSKWFNYISAEITIENLNNITNFSFVKEVELLERFRKDYEKEKLLNDDNEIQIPNIKNNITDLNYGSSLTQNQQINVIPIHNMGNYGQGVMVCLMDAGFNRLTHEAFNQLSVWATYDFVNHRPYVGDGQGGQGEGSHGTQTLSTIGGYKNGQLIGPAFKSKYLLAKTENTDSETPIEMDNWVAALEWADSIGVDVTSTSLGYLDFDPPYTSLTWMDMDGNTALITRAGDLAVKKGIVVVNSAGNEGYNATHNTLGAPADGDSVIAIGAVSSSGTRVSFSSVGNTVDGRIKPDLMAMGSGVAVASPYGDFSYTTASGTSFSCPLAAGVVALILSENPNLTPMKIREALRKTANNSTNPNREYGWGIINAYNAMNYYNISFKSGINFDSTNLFGPYKISLKLTSRLTINQNKVFLIWGKNSFTDTLLMTKVSTDSFFANIYGDGSAGTYKYYFYAETTTDSIYKTYPKSAPTDYFTFTTYATYINSSVQYNQDWNLISIPLALNNFDYTNVFPNAIGNAYTFDNNYVSVNTLKNGTGYWVKFPMSYSHTYNGALIGTLNVPVKAGWNLVGTINDSVNVNSITSTPQNIIISSFFAFDNGYSPVTYLTKGKGYWVKVSSDGYITIKK